MARSSSIGSIGSTACAGAEGSVMESSCAMGRRRDRRLRALIVTARATYPSGFRSDVICHCRQTEISVS
jgi:hypothetical protein